MIGAASDVMKDLTASTRNHSRDKKEVVLDLRGAQKIKGKKSSKNTANAIILLRGDKFTNAELGCCQG